MGRIAKLSALFGGLTLVAVLAGCGGNLDKEDAAKILQNSPDVDFSKTIIVDLGFLNAHCGQPPTTGKYALLQKAGVISINSGTKSTEVVTTDKGDTLFKQVGAQRMDTGHYSLVTGQQLCNVNTWVVPIATRQVMDVNVTPAGDNTADVTYSWMWRPNDLGQAFTPQSEFYKSLPTKMQDELNDGELPLDNSLPHASKVKFVHDGTGWHVSKSDQ